MNAFVIYDTEYGNTERSAQAIADALRGFGEVRAARIDPAHSIEVQGIDMLVVGGPTQGWRPTPKMQSFLEAITSEQIRGVGVACFDTRLRMLDWLTGSAAKVMARKLQERGAMLIVPPESFFVKGDKDPLQSGELDRAATWGRMLVEALEAAQPVTQ